MVGVVSVCNSTLLDLPAVPTVGEPIIALLLGGVLKVLRATLRGDLLVTGLQASLATGTLVNSLGRGGVHRVVSATRLEVGVYCLTAGLSTDVLGDVTSIVRSTCLGDCVATAGGFADALTTAVSPTLRGAPTTDFPAVEVSEMRLGAGFCVDSGESLKVTTVIFSDLSGVAN